MAIFEQNTASEVSVVSIADNALQRIVFAIDAAKNAQQQSDLKLTSYFNNLDDELKNLFRGTERISDSLDDAERQRRRGDREENRRRVRSEAAQRKDRATQLALYGKVDKGQKQDNIFKRNFKSLFDDLLNTLKKHFSDSVKYYQDTAKQWRLQNLTLTQSEKATKMGDETFQLLSDSGFNLLKDDISQYYKELVAGGKDLEIMTMNQRASYALLRDRGIEDAKAYTLAMTTGFKQILEMSHAIGDPKRRKFFTDYINGIDEVSLALKGTRRTIDDAIAASKNVSEKTNVMGLQKMVDIALNRTKLDTGQLNEYDAELGLMTNTITGDFKTIGTQVKQQVKSLSDNQLRIFNGINKEIANVLGTGKLFSDTGQDRDMQVRSDDDNIEADKDNTKEGKVVQVINNIITQLNEWTGGWIEKLSRYIDHAMGDSATLVGIVGSLVGGIASIAGVKLLLGKFTGGISGLIPKIVGFGSKILRFGSTVLKGVGTVLKGIGTKLFAPIAIVATAISYMKSIFENRKVISEWMQGWIGEIKLFLKQPFDYIGNAYQAISSDFEGFKDYLSDLFGKMLSPITDPVVQMWNYFKEKFPSIFDTMDVIRNWIREKVGGVWDWIWGSDESPEKDKDGKPKKKEDDSGLLKSVEDALSSAGSGIKSIFDIIFSDVKPLQREQIDTVYTQPKPVPENKFKDGGTIFSKIKNAVLGEDGREVIFPMTKPWRVKQILDDMSKSDVGQLFSATYSKVKEFLGVEDKDKNTIAQNAITYARNQLGKPYSIYNDGYVCNTLVQSSYKAAGMKNFPSQTAGRHWKDSRLHKIPLSLAPEGSIGFSNLNKETGLPKHMGIITKDGNWINASGSSPSFEVGKFKASPTSRGVVEVPMPRKGQYQMVGAGFYDGMFDDATSKILASVSRDNPDVYIEGEENNPLNLQKPVRFEGLTDANVKYLNDFLNEYAPNVKETSVLSEQRKLYQEALKSAVNSVPKEMRSKAESIKKQAEQQMNSGTMQEVVASMGLAVKYLKDISSKMKTNPPKPVAAPVKQKF